MKCENVNTRRSKSRKNQLNKVRLFRSGMDRFLHSYGFKEPGKQCMRLQSPVFNKRLSRTHSMLDRSHYHIKWRPLLCLLPCFLKRWWIENLYSHRKTWPATVYCVSNLLIIRCSHFSRYCWKNHQNTPWDHFWHSASIIGKDVVLWCTWN